jgi:hypothetical protein
LASTCPRHLLWAWSAEITAPLSSASSASLLIALLFWGKLSLLKW